MAKFIASLFNDKVFYDQLITPNVKHEIKTYKPNEKIIKQGNDYNFFCFIKSGTVRVTLNEEGEGKAPIRTIIATLEAGDTFGEFKLFGDFTASADVITVTESQIVLVDIKSFLVFLENDPKTGFKILFEIVQSLVKRMHNTNSTILHLMHSAIEFQKQLQKLVRQV